MANTTGEKEIQTDWPIEEGITLGTTKLRKQAHLIPDVDNVSESEWVGME